MTDTLERIWPEIQMAIGNLDSGPEGSVLLEVGLRGDPNVNQIWLSENGLVRMSDGATSVKQEIPAQNFIDFAREAIENPSQLICINNDGISKCKYLKPGMLGSFVCTCLALLPYFQYRRGQYLIFLPDRI